MHMKWRIYALWIVIAEAVGALSGWLTRSGVADYTANALKPPLTPPGVVFPIAWAILYALMGIAAARVQLAGSGAARMRALRLFCIQLAFNFLWSIVFFNLQWYGFALGWLFALWALILATIIAFHGIDVAAAWLMVPYIAWVTFAVYLNFGVWLLNR